MAIAAGRKAHSIVTPPRGARFGMRSSRPRPSACWDGLVWDDEPRREFDLIHIFSGLLDARAAHELITSDPTHAQHTHWTSMTRKNVGSRICLALTWKEQLLPLPPPERLPRASIARWGFVSNSKPTFSSTVRAPKLSLHGRRVSTLAVRAAWNFPQCVSWFVALRLGSRSSP